LVSLACGGSQVTSTGDGEAVWLQQECAATAEMPTLCRNNFDDGGVAFVASTPCESCRQAEADAKGIDKVKGSVWLGC
jgi:hypothetical protein